jgi:hypothetical protein
LSLTVIGKEIFEPTLYSLDESPSSSKVHLVVGKPLAAVISQVLVDGVAVLASDIS